MGQPRGSRKRNDLRTHGLLELGQVASGSSAQGLRLGNREVGSQVVGKDKSRLPGRGTVGEKKAMTEQRRECTDFGSDLGQRDEYVVCHASALPLAMKDEAYREAEM